ncbi:ATP-binding protein [Nocardioides sp. NPDC051685]|uniref:ATP-binding protein n=1 Tax=Nocardioides sp. NPDC051685 TaxID=3364334 RepID=UPI0037AE3FDB
MFGRSLRARVAWSTAAVTAVVMVAMIGVVGFIISGLTTRQIDEALGYRVEAAAESLHVDAGGDLALAPSQADDVDDRVWVFDAGGDLVAGPRLAAGLSAPVRSLSGVTTEKTLVQDERRYLARPVQVAGAEDMTAVLVASESVEPYERTRDVALISLLVLGAVVVAGTAALSAWTVGRTLRPVHQMTALAADWSERDLETRFDLTEGSDEFTELGNTLDALLDRVATALRDEQRLTAELAHELRTPLTAIRGEAELGRNATPTDERYVRIIELVDRLSASITTLLALARNRTGSTLRADPAEVMADLTAALPRHDVDVVVDIPPGRYLVAAPPELVERAVAPVLDNAVRHASRRVLIAATESDNAIGITLSDDGPGVDPEHRETIFDAGTRFTDGDGDGAGLGLALARRVAVAAGGDVRLVSTAGPTTFEIRFPRWRFRRQVT